MVADTRNESRKFFFVADGFLSTVAFANELEQSFATGVDFDFFFEGIELLEDTSIEKKTPPILKGNKIVLGDAQKPTVLNWILNITLPKSSLNNVDGLDYYFFVFRLKVQSIMALHRYPAMEVRLSSSNINNYGFNSYAIGLIIAACFHRKLMGDRSTKFNTFHPLHVPSLGFTIKYRAGQGIFSEHAIIPNQVLREYQRILYPSLLAYEKKEISEIPPVRDEISDVDELIQVFSTSAIEIVQAISNKKVKYDETISLNDLYGDFTTFYVSVGRMKLIV